MDRDLTVNSIDFNFSYDEKGKIVRQSSARGVNTPDILTIQRMDARDNVNNVATRRFNVRVSRIDQTAEGAKFDTSFAFTIVVPEFATDTEINAVKATFKAFVASTSPDYIAAVLNNE
jgi:hypothetical protein